MQNLNKGLTHVTTVIVHMGGVGEEPSVESWNTSELDWYDILDLLHFLSLCSVHEKMKKVKTVEGDGTLLRHIMNPQKLKITSFKLKQFISNKKALQTRICLKLSENTKIVSKREYRKSVLLTKLIFHHSKTCCCFKRFVKLEL